MLSLGVLGGGVALQARLATPNRMGVTSDQHYQNQRPESARRCKRPHDFFAVVADGTGAH